MIYHIFTHNHDEYTDEKDYAYATYREFVAENKCARLYKLKDIDDEQGDCIESFGQYPQ